MTLDIRFIHTGDVPAFRTAVVRAFGHDYKPDPQLDARFEASFDLDLSIGAFDGDQLVGTFSSFDLDLNVPGSTVPMAGTTVVSVLPTHRRRGVLSQMMRLHLQQAIDRGQPIAGLWATEFGIYGRFGYGPANTVREVGFDTRRADVAGPEPGVELRMVEPEEGGELAGAVYPNAVSGIPGTFERPEWWWTHRVLLDHPQFREGMGEERWVVAESGGIPIGYARYRVKMEWESSGPNGKLSITEVIGTTDGAYRALWHHLSHVDLFPNVSCWNLPENSVLPWIISDPRHLTYALWDGLWIRLLDIPNSLQARSYSSDGSVVIGVDDRFTPHVGGTFEVCVSGGAATVERSGASPHLELDVADLGSLYLGQHRAEQLRKAGRIVGDADAISHLDRMMSWPVPSWTQEIF
jgi:predicted acetyltransferase